MQTVKKLVLDRGRLQKHAVDGSDIAQFKDVHGLTVKDACSVLGIATPHKYGALINEKSDNVDLSLALLVRFYGALPKMVPKIRPLDISAAFKMFQDVLGDELNESVFAQLFGRTPGSGYRWLRDGANSRATPPITRMLDRIGVMQELGYADDQIVEFWISLAREEYMARGKPFLLDEKKKAKGLRQKRSNRKTGENKNESAT